MHFDKHLWLQSLFLVDKVEEADKKCINKCVKCRLTIKTSVFPARFELLHTIFLSVFLKSETRTLISPESWLMNIKERHSFETSQIEQHFLCVTKIARETWTT